MNHSPHSAREYIRKITHLLPVQYQNRLIFLAPALTLSTFSEELTGTQFGYGAQNCHFKDQGAFTGENSPHVLKQMGTTHCLTGHSERRRFFSETDDLIQKKVMSLLKHQIEPVICVGETEEERKKNLSFHVVEKQLSGILKNSFFAPVCIAYEPIWAIGSGLSAEPQQIADMQTCIQQLCESAGQKLHFLYGGSVNAENAKTLSQIPGVNGFLVGGASLDPQIFFNLFQETLVTK